MGNEEQKNVLTIVATAINSIFFNYGTYTLFTGFQLFGIAIFLRKCYR